MRHARQMSLFEDDVRPVRGDKPVNVASVPQYSPFRYPGGKTWFIPTFRRWMTALPQRPLRLVEPFAGGGGISLTAIMEGLADEVVMVELDEQVAAVWQTIIRGDAEWLARKILSFDLTPESARETLERTPRDTRQLAFQTILRNRVLHGGILARGSSLIKRGENGKGITSRWYPATLARRIMNIARVADRIRFVHGDGMQVLEGMMDDEAAAFFIDPPYTAGGKRAGRRLYTHHEVDHERLFSLCAQLCGHFLMTYDNAEEVRELADRHGFGHAAVAMKNTHHATMRELVISRDLSWLA